jgi:hypothetical protein
MKRSVWSKLVLLALASCVSVVACGDDDDSSGGNTAGKAGGNEGGDDNAAGHNGSAGNTNIAGTGGNGGSAGGSAAGTGPVGGEGGTGNNTVIGGAAGNAGESAAGTGNEAGAPLGGAGGSDGSGGEGGGSACLVPASYGDLGSPDASATQIDASTLRLVAYLAPNQQLFLELYKGSPPFNGTFKTGTFDIEGAQLNYETCGVCALVYEGVIGNTYRTSYFATGGSVTITSLSPKLSGSINDVPFESVDIDPNDNYHTTPLDDGCTTAVKLAFDETVQQ